MIWKCLLVDDEPLAIEVLQNHILAVDQLQVAGTCNSALTAMEFLTANPVDLMFLDIQMPRLTGPAMLRDLIVKPKVIFTTAFKEYAADAFELDAVDYLLKPVSFERFLRAINKLPNLNQPTHQTPVQTDGSGFIYFRADRKMIKLFYDEILYIESIKDYIRIVRDGNTPLLVKQTISATEEMLPRHLFMRIHRSFIVAVRKITAFTQNDIEISQIEIPIGRQYRDQIKRLSHIDRNQT